MIVAAAGLLLVGLGGPHLVRTRAGDPAVMALLWGANLGLRALTGTFLALYLVLFLPSTGLFSALTHWCWHTVLPLLATHLGFSGHSLGDFASLLPMMLIAASLIWVAFGIWRIARSVRRMLGWAVVGAGPAQSLIVGGTAVVVAAAGLTRPRVLVSAGALTQLDDEELAAGLEHEHGHILRRHRWILVYGEMCRALALFIPGTRSAWRELQLQLERDADCWAISKRHDRLALASAIVKAATSSVRTTAPLAGLGGRDEHLTHRVAELVHPANRAESVVRGRLLKAAALAGCLLTLGFAVILPSAVAAGLARPTLAGPVHPCPA